MSNTTRRTARSRHRGAFHIFTLLGMSLIFGSAALTFDYGRASLEKANAQNAADAAAFAAALDLPNETKAGTTARRVAAANSCPEPTLTFERDVLGQATSIRVQAGKNVPTIFAGMMGMTDVGVSAAARVSAAFPANKTYRYMPWGVQMQDFALGQLVTLKTRESDENPAPGNFNCLALAGSGGSEYRDLVREGHPGPLRAWQWVTTEPGNKAGPTYLGLTDRFEAASQPPYADDTYESITRGNPRVVIVPLVDWDLAFGGRTTVPVLGFGCFWLERTWESDQNCNVEGRFIQYVDPSKAVRDPAALPGLDFGVRDPRLDRCW